LPNIETDIEEILKLYDFGLEKNWFEDFPLKGLRFLYNNAVYIIGGKVEGECSPEELEIINNGIWLPQAEHLMFWLKNNYFAFNFCYEGEGGSGTTLYCKDTKTATEYETVGDLEFSLARTIRKILKRKERQFTVKNRFLIEMVLF
jgi:hypothetical protein